MQFLKKRMLIVLFLLILIVGFFLRVYKLPDIPTGFFCDEASIGYNAYKILTTGHDEFGFFLPVFFKAFGEYKNPVEIYSTVPSILFLGLNEFSVRIVSVVYGIGCLVALYFLTSELWNNSQRGKYIALFSMLILAISPWHIHMSRISMEGIIPYVFFVILGTYFFLKIRQNIKFLLLSTLVFGVGMYTYFPSRVFIPLLVMFLFMIYYKYILKNIKFSLLSLLLGLIILLPYFWAIHDGSIFARWNQVSIFSSPPKNQSIIAHIFTNYVRHFSFDFLFLKGDVGMPGQFITRQSVKGIGELYLFQFPLILLGMFYFIKHKTKEGILFFIWLILYPTGSIFTTSDSPTATRSIIGVIPFTVFSAVGAYYLIELAKKIFGKDYGELIFLFLIGVMIVSVYFYTNIYFVQYPLYSSDFWGWQYGAKPVISYFVTHEHQYDQFFMEGAFNAPYIFFDFYAPHGCGNCYVGDPKANVNPRKKQLFAITSNYLQENPSTKMNVKKIVYYPNGLPAFYIGEVKR